MFDTAHKPQQAGILTYGLDTARPHTLKIVVSGERNASSTGAYVGIDAFDIGPPDSLAPSVDIIAPAYGAVVSGMVTISAIASDNVGVSGVTFYADDYFLGEDRSPPYSITVDASGVPHGSYHLIRANAFDLNNGSAPDFVQVRVDAGGAADVYSPTLAMTAPAHNSVVGGNVTISANAADNVGVTKVEFLASGIVIGEDNTAPYAITRSTSGLPNGSTYTLSARAYDAAGNISDGSSSVNVTVQNP